MAIEPSIYAIVSSIALFFAGLFIVISGVKKSKTSFVLIGIFAVAISAIIITKGKLNFIHIDQGGLTAGSGPGNSFKYKLNENEKSVMASLLADEVTEFSRGNNSFLGGKFLRVSSSEISNEYKENQVRADQKYFNKELLITGIIESINSGIGNEPYVVLRGENLFLAPQVHFEDPNIQKISALEQGNKVSFVCLGGGSIAGTPIFKKCSFADDVAMQQLQQLSKETADFLKGTARDDVVGFIPILSISFSRILPRDSPCFTEKGSCKDALQEIQSKKPLLLSQTIQAVSKELQDRGLVFSKQLQTALQDITQHLKAK